MENACSKRKPAAQLTKDQLQGESKQNEQETEAVVDLKEADADTLKNRRRLKIVRTQGPTASVCPEQLPMKETATETKVQSTPEPTPQTAESPATVTAETAASTAAASAPAATTADSAAAAPDGEKTAAPAPEGDAANASAGTESGSSAGLAAAAGAAAGDASADAAPTSAPNGNATAGSNSSDSSSGNSSSSSSSNGSSGGGLFGSVLKGTSTFVSPFGTLGATGSSFLLPSAGTTEGGSTSLFKGPATAPSAEAEEADAQPPEEPTVVTTTVDSKEEIIFTDRDCRMQCFDIENKVWTPKPPLDGKVDFVAPKKGEEEGLPNARILFFVNRTGRLRLNSPVLPSTVKFRHPVERSAASAAAKTTSPGAATNPESGSAEGAKEVPVKKNTVEFTGLKIDAKDAKDTTFYRIRFSNDERAAEFIALANAKQEEAAKAAQNGGTQ